MQDPNTNDKLLSDFENVNNTQRELSMLVSMMAKVLVNNEADSLLRTLSEEDRKLVFSLIKLTDRGVYRSLKL